jgi:transcriptional regulator with XRE-family HTH domain
LRAFGRISQNLLSEKTELSRQMLSAIENGRVANIKKKHHNVLREFFYGYMQNIDNFLGAKIYMIAVPLLLDGMLISGRKVSAFEISGISDSLYVVSRIFDSAISEEFFVSLCELIFPATLPPKLSKGHTLSGDSKMWGLDLYAESGLMDIFSDWRTFQESLNADIVDHF